MKPLARPLLASQIAKATSLPYTGQELSISHICTDTRQLSPGSLFVAIKGENFDGHDYIAQALEKGAALALSHKESSDPRVLRVKDTRLALLDIAGFYRRLLAPKVAAVTGSVGKTTTKEMAACVLSAGYKTLKTPQNLNNEVGLSQTIFMLEQDHGAAMLELGIDGPGQMSQLAVAAGPDVGIVTGIGVAHLEHLGSRQGILEEKMHIRDGMADGALLLLNADNDLLQDFTDDRLQILRYGMENPKSDVKGEIVREGEQSTDFAILWQGTRYTATLPIIGRHNVMNAIAAFVAGVHLGVPPEKAAQALEDYQPEGMRQRTVQRAGFTIVEDCYNASPDSMQAALETFDKMPCKGRRIAVFSDMLELGPSQRQDHFDVGKLAGQGKVDLLLCTGPLSEEYLHGAQGTGLEVIHYPDQAGLLEGLKQAAKPGDVLWFKASRGMRFESLLTKFYSEM